MLIKELKKAGLTEKEAGVYLAALELGETSIARLSQKSKIKRATVYLAVDSLKEKGLLSMIKKRNKAYFYAEDPRKLEQDLESKKVSLQKAMPEILSIANFLDKKPKVKYFDGQKALEEVFNDMLSYPGQEILAWIPGYHYNIPDEFIFDHFIPSRIRKKIWVRIIAPKTETTIKYKKDEQKQLGKFKLLVPSKFDIKMGIYLYGRNKVGIISNKEDISMIIESQGVYEGMKSIFEVMWENLPD